LIARELTLTVQYDKSIEEVFIDKDTPAVRGTAQWRINYSPDNLRGSSFLNSDFFTTRPAYTGHFAKPNDRLTAVVLGTYVAYSATGTDLDCIIDGKVWSTIIDYPPGTSPLHIEANLFD